MSAKTLQIGELLEVEIEKLAYGSNGIARLRSTDRLSGPGEALVGFVVFVPYSAPGDKLQVQVTMVKPRHAEAKIVQILQPSTQRQQPLCPVYGKCGGCDWQHLDYSSQLQYKQINIQHFLNRTVPKDTEVSLLPPVASPDPFYYRNRVQLKYANGDLGFFAKQSHKIVDIQSCPLMDPFLNEELPRLRAKLDEKPGAQLQRIELQLLQNGKVKTRMLTGPLDEHTNEAPDANIESEMDLGFSQVNQKQNTQLIETFLQWSAEVQSQTLYDLYAGSGNFTFPWLAKHPKVRMIAVEGHAGAVQLARQQLSVMKIGPKRCEFFASDVELFLRRQLPEKGATVLIDPPRTGCSEYVIRSLALANLERIYYISCDPAALSRDLQRLFAAAPDTWTLRRAQAFDMFPQTHHVETLVELVRKVDS